ncbi:hypothetical protein ZIOFF_069579 [Zingiber officinale]|uniref:Uncharacterized protein n=1 Tax=Zingiber officinale TaxID=94328 RepID=A0A8J5CBW8_ZINOF|nr:hypothetical protein ZIOFF_069579 [Zingiber officinale]
MRKPTGNIWSLSGATKLRSNSWGLHMPLICPDGAVVAYAWKRQLAGQAGASAVDRTRIVNKGEEEERVMRGIEGRGKYQHYEQKVSKTLWVVNIPRLALKAFTDQKRRFFPHLEDELSGDGDLGIANKRWNSLGSVRNQREEFRENKSLSDVLRSLEHEFPNVRIFTYQRLDWSKRASSLSSENTMDPFKDQIVNHPSNLSSGAVNVAAADQAAVIELLVPFIFRAVVSLHPAGSINPDAVAFFAAAEVSIHRLFNVFQSEFFSLLSSL